MPKANPSVPIAETSGDAIRRHAANERNSMIVEGFGFGGLRASNVE